jgi:hypothetical protein
LQALGLRFDLSLAHHYLGVALARLHDDARAIQAFETCLRYQPGWTPAHRYLAVLYQRQPNGIADGQRHRDYLKGRVTRRNEWRAFQQSLRREAAERARQRAAARKALRESTRKIDASKEGIAAANKQPPSASEPMDFLIVSGLPRSGTSLTMQLLAAAGVPIMTDDTRPADESNVLGYFEWQEIKKLPKNPFVIEKARDRAVKVISMLLPSLPKKHRFRIIFMQRSIEDVAASQEKLRQRRSTSSPPDREKMTAWLRDHRDRIVELLREAPNVDLLEIDYDDLIANPRPNLEKIAQFAGIDPVKIDKMAPVIDPDLRHFSNRSRDLSAIH